MTADILNDLPPSAKLHVYRKLRADGGNTIVIKVKTRAPDGTYRNPVRISCDYATVPVLAEALQWAMHLTWDQLPVHGGQMNPRHSTP